MIYRTPDYYRDFSCIADACEDTCCAGWQIVVDELSLKKYRGVKGSFKNKLRGSIQWKEKVFKQDDERRCAFLNDKNLCDMYTALGADSLCRTCRTYPRHIEEFEGVREISLSISCPEVARILMEKTEPVRFITYTNDKEEEYVDFDFFLYDILLEARDAMLYIAQNRSLSLWVRAGLILAMAHDMQGRIQRGQMFPCRDVIQKYESSYAVDQITLKVKEYLRDAEAQFYASRDFFRLVKSLEPLRSEWQMILMESEMTLHEKGALHYARLSHDFSDSIENEEIIHLEQLLVYFIFTYFCGAVYDERIYAKTKMSLVSVFFLRDLMIARKEKNEGVLDLDDWILLSYHYSRELEHSDENLEQMEKRLLKDRNWF